MNPPPARLYKQEQDELERRLPMLTNKLLAAVGLAAALVLGVAGTAEARGFGGGFHRGPVSRGPVYGGPVYRTVVYRPVYAPVYVAPPHRHMDWRRAEWHRHHHDDRRY
jgi:hypothetical protein